MKRYVKELANDILCKGLPEEKMGQIKKAVKLCERGYITSCEAARLILDEYYNS